MINRSFIKVYLSWKDDFNILEGLHKTFTFFKGHFDSIELVLDLIFWYIFLSTKTFIGPCQGADHTFFLSSIFEIDVDVGGKLKPI